MFLSTSWLDHSFILINKEKILNKINEIQRNKKNEQIESGGGEETYFIKCLLDEVTGHDGNQFSSAMWVAPETARVR